MVSTSIGGSVVECSPATRAARVRFPADAHFEHFYVRLQTCPWVWERKNHFATEFSSQIAEWPVSSSHFIVSNVLSPKYNDRPFGSSSFYSLIYSFIHVSVTCFPNICMFL